MLKFYNYEVLNHLDFYSYHVLNNWAITTFFKTNTLLYNIK